MASSGGRQRKETLEWGGGTLCSGEKEQSLEDEDEEDEEDEEIDWATVWNKKKPRQTVEGERAPWWGWSGGEDDSNVAADWSEWTEMRN